jgi:hypothetical protein
MLRFTERKELTASDALTEAQRAQLDVIGPLYFGGTGAARLADDDYDDDPTETRTLLSCAVLKGVDGARHVYDAWFYMTDSGTIFKAGSSERVAEIIQCGLQCGNAKLRSALGPAMVAANLLPRSDSCYEEFAALLEMQKAAPKKPKKKKPAPKKKKPTAKKKPTRKKKASKKRKRR